MPNMNGLRLTEEILKKWPNSKVAILTSEIEIFYVDEARRVGAAGFLHKIIDHKNIVRALREVHQDWRYQSWKIEQIRVISHYL